MPITSVFAGLAGTPGTAMLVVVRNLDVLHAELHQRGYPYLNRVRPPDRQAKYCRTVEMSPDHLVTVTSYEG
jgi:hypothetical protein